MKKLVFIQFLAVLLLLTACVQKKKNEQMADQLFPHELVDFVPYAHNPVFRGTGTDTWDKQIRERGYILKEGNTYKMWYTGYDGVDTSVKYLGYAISDDGIHWKRYPGNPIFDEYWTEDVFVIRHNGTYYMVAEGKGDVAHMLTSEDGIHWQRRGNLDIRKVDGTPIDPGPYGTPTLWIENGKWYLFYERDDLGIWLATSTDHEVWTNVRDDPVIKMGPGKYDSKGVAMDQVIKYNGRYYGYYHGTPDEDWATWNSNVAVSDDLIHWKKYDENPIVDTDSISDNYSSPILVYDGKQYRLYTMHGDVRLFFPRSANK